MKRIAATLIAASLTGCLTDTGSSSDADTSVPAAARGTYGLRSHFDITVEALLPDTAYDAVQTLESFRDDPAGTLFSDLPGPIKDTANGLIKPLLPELLDDVIAVAQTTLTGFDLDSSLVVGDDARHQLTAIHYAPVTGLEISVPLGVVPAASATAQAKDGELVVGSHAFGLAYGEYAYQALEAASRAKTGVGLREALGQRVDCAAVAAEIADQCVLGVCVGDVFDVTSMCEDALDEAVQKLHDQLTQLDFEALRLEGHATMQDGSLAGGVWQAAINLGQGPRDVPATFSGTM